IDQAIYFKMLGMIDHSLLIKVEQAGLSRDYFGAFSQGLEAARIFGRTVLVYLGEMHRPDFVAEIADMLIRLQDAHAVLCSGYHGSTLYLSLRTETGGEDAGNIVQGVIFPPGKAGGHGSMAGGQVPISGQPVDLLVSIIERRFLDIMGEAGQGEPLLPNNETAALDS
ncbi:MAG TPA: DHH family phosphoesterase, partial [Anaerolineales bacterium]|nr:DHH family phosphoesterase [Anaerolineales bacterium]